MAFFAGRATLRQAVNLPALDGRVVLETHDLRAAIANVRVNGQAVGTLAWLPHRVEITSGSGSLSRVV